MRENFDKIKKIELRKAKIFSAALGVCCGLAVTGIFLLAFKLSAIQLGWYIYLVFGVCAALILGAASYFVQVTGTGSVKSRGAEQKSAVKRKLSRGQKTIFKYRLYDCAAAAVVLVVSVIALVYYGSVFSAANEGARAVREAYIVLFSVLTAAFAALLAAELARALVLLFGGSRPVRAKTKTEKSAVNAYDIKLAKKLDNEYSLGEKAQTLIEFEGQDGAMLALQREDAEAAIGGITLKRPAAKNIAKSCAVAAVCVALFVSGVIVKQRVIVEPVPVDEQPYEITDTQLIILNTLIENVESDTSLDGELKQKCVASLNSLKDYFMGGSATNGGMVTEVQATMLEISAYTFDTNTYDDFITAFGEVDGGTIFAWAFYDSAVCYKSSANINSYDTVISKSKTIDDDISDIMQDYIDDIIAVTDATEFATNLETTITTYRQILDDAINSTEVSEDDGLYSAVETLRAEFLKYANRINVDGYTIEAFHTGLSDALNTFSRTASTALRAQVYNCMMDEYMRQSLSDNFGVAVQGLSNPQPLDEESGSSGDGSVSSGGAGSGETLYGSDDYIYNPNTGEYVQYGELLNAETNGYLSRLYAMLDSDDISDEVKSYIRAYINKLLGTSDSE